ncbi:hypothetical protein NM688_g3903 [Phlebia brevispora]|uniref:Uncharacterized protein n=1 Tax=Phlebia brevispora TaxID=194682 RepID=A0ACC1T496_9APHY|nr:hypothetical protein NM688_g3903 [Phlebia brevispora]
MPKRKRTVSNPIAPSTVVAETSSTAVASAVVQETPPARRRSSRAKKVKKAIVDEEIPWDYPNREDSPLTELEDDEFQEKSHKKSPGKRKRRKKVEEPVVYDIPPVERKYTNFKGRTCRLDTIRKNGLDFAKNLGLQNSRDLYKLIEWNEENNIRFLRVSSEMFPFASHKEHGYTLEYAKDELKRAGDLAKKLGHRLTTHPGQFTQLASPKENVVEASIRELDYHCQMLRYMGLDQNSVIIIHMGGVYGDKASTLERFKVNYTNKLTDEMKARVVLENDEMCYNADDLLPVCNELNIPIVLDYHHNWIYPSVHPLNELIPMINATWIRKGIKPKQHLSSPRPGCEEGTVMEKRAHADRCYSLPDELVLTPPPHGDGEESVEVDLMIEAKDKEQAVFLLYRIYDLAPVKHDNLRPEKAQKSRAEDAEGEEANNAEEAIVAKTARKTTRRRKVVKPTDEIQQGEAPTDQATASAAATKKRKSRKEKHAEDVNAASSALNVEDESTSLMNQEDTPVAVDGAKVKEIEGQEHPEAAVAAHEDGDGYTTPVMQSSTPPDVATPSNSLAPPSDTTNTQNSSSQSSLPISAPPVNRSPPRFKWSSILSRFTHPIALAYLYRTIILFTLPNHYESRIVAIDESPEATTLVKEGVAFSSDYWSAGALCTIFLPLSGALLQVPRVADSSLSTVLDVLALICALEGLLLSAVCHCHFSSIKHNGHASRWAQYARESFSRKWGNIAVLLSMPTVNLAWSVIFILFAILSMFACPQVVCTMIDRMLARSSDTGTPLVLAVFVFLRTAHFLFVILTFRRLHNHCCKQISDSEINLQENGRLTPRGALRLNLHLHVCLAVAFCSVKDTNGPEAIPASKAMANNHGDSPNHGCSFVCPLQTPRSRRAATDATP